jgi:Suppressor of fused protein (SUFU)
MSEADEKPEVSEAGNPILRHKSIESWLPATGDSSLEQISAHIAAHLGEVETVFHEIASDIVHVDVHIAKPSPQSPFYRLVSSGMSDLPMNIPEGLDVPKFLELMVTLPPDWKLDTESLKDERWYWPVRLLKFLARFPHKYNTWLGYGHTIPNEDPPKPYASDTKLRCAMILPSPTVPEKFITLEIGREKTIYFLAVLPLYLEEMQLKLQQGGQAFLEKLAAAQVTDVINPRRPSLAPRRKKFGIF